MIKLCSKCGEPGEFCKDSKSVDDMQSQCKKCKSLKAQEIRNNGYYKNDRANKMSCQRYKKWAKNNRDKLRLKSLRSYHKNKVSRNMSRQMRRSIGSLKNGSHWEKLIGYKLKDLKLHLEKLFQPNMSWDNYGEWHIDHVIPVSSFDITSVECNDFKECWSLSNLQPLWASENASKGNKIRN